MAASWSLIVKDSSGRSGTDLGDIKQPSDKPRQAIIRAINRLEAMISGNAAGSVDIDVSSSNAVAASGSITFASVLNNDTISFNGVSFTAKTSSPTGDQFLVGVSDTADAAAAAAAINASTTALIQGYITASAASGVLTITCLQKGLIGNSITIASSNGTRLAVTGSAARLSGGTGVNSSSGPTTYALGA